MWILWNVYMFINIYELLNEGGVIYFIFCLVKFNRMDLMRLGSF